MKSALALLAFVFLGATNLTATPEPEDQNHGVLEVVYEPKVCIMAPCPQYRVVTMNSVKVQGIGADILNFESQKSAAAAFKTFSIEGEWTRTEDYLEVTASAWHAVVGEKLPQKTTKSRTK